MPECVATGVLGDAGPAHGPLDGILKVVFEDVVTTGDSRSWIDRAFGGGEDVLPCPLAGGGRALTLIGIGQVDGSVSFLQIHLVQGARVFQLAA